MQNIYTGWIATYAGSQYLDTGWVSIAATLLVVFFVLFNIARAQRGKKELFIRRIPGLNALDDAIGRATEMGRPVLMVPGIGTLDAISVQALSIFAHVTKSAAQFSTPIKLCCADAAVYTVAQEVIRDVYQRQGMGDRYDTDYVQFISDRQFAFAAGVSGIIHREKVAAAFLLGAFYAESLIFAETCNTVGAIQVAGSTQTTQTPFFIAACDYVLIGDEFYAASAYLTREPVLVGSLVGQDWGKMTIAAAMVLGTGMLSLEMTQPAELERFDVSNGTVFQPVDEERAAFDDQRALKKKNETTIYRIFNPAVYPDYVTNIERPQKPEEEAEGGGE